MRINMSIKMMLSLVQIYKIHVTIFFMKSSKIRLFSKKQYFFKVKSDNYSYCRRKKKEKSVIILFTFGSKMAGNVPP